MARPWTRRDVLKHSVGAATAASLTRWGIAPSCIAAEDAGRPLRHADDDKIKRLGERIIEAEPGQVVDIVATAFESGMSREQLLAANFVAGMRFRGHHYAFVAHPVNDVSNAVPAGDRLLPIFYHLSALKDSTGRPWREIDLTRLPPARKAAEFFHAAMAEGDRDTAIRSMLALAREHGPRQAYDHLWMYGAERNHRSGGHTAITVVNTFRTLEAIGWRCAEIGLRFAVDTPSVKPRGSDLHLVNRARTDRIAELPHKWSATTSDRAAVLELMDLYRKGNPDKACQTTFNWLLNGKVRAGSVWDSVFLTSAEEVARYIWVGPKMLAGHAVTCSNALHFIFRTVNDPATRLYALLEAVQWTTSFLKRERARPALRKRDLFQVTPAALAKDGDSLESIFETIPVRRRRQFSPVLLPACDRAQELALAWATTHADHAPFFRRALQLLCIKATNEVHDYKFPIALFENYRYASGEWKPHLLAASVYVLQGLQIEDAPMLAEARERIG